MIDGQVSKKSLGDARPDKVDPRRGKVFPKEQDRRRREYGIAHAKKASHQENSLDLRLTKIGPLLGRRRSQPIHHPHDTPACRSIQAVAKRLLCLAGHCHSQSFDESNESLLRGRSNAEGLPKDFAKITFLKDWSRCSIIPRG